MKRFLSFLTALAICCCAFASQSLGLHTVVIDAGHGGKDPGGVSPDKKNFEKNFALDIARKLASKISEECPDVNVILTRDNDTYLTLNQRAEIANNANADLFISVHINSVLSRAANGYSVHVLGESRQENRDLYAYNLEVCKRENSVICLEDGYKTSTNGFDPNNPESYIFMTMMQSAYLEQSLEFAQIILKEIKAGGPFTTNHGVSQDPFYVLWKTSMPAVLVELGFISNSDDLWALQKEANRDAIANCLLSAFKTYKKRYDASMSIGSSPTPQTAPSGQPHPAAPSDREETAVQQTSSPSQGGAVLYGVQIFAVSNKLPEGDSRLLGYRPEIIKAGNLFKYVIGISADMQEAKSSFLKIKEKYPDSYLVRISGGSLERL